MGWTGEEIEEMQENKRNKESVGLKWERLPSEEEEAVDSVERDAEDTDVLEIQLI